MTFLRSAVALSSPRTSIWIAVTDLSDAELTIAAPALKGV
jgi:hypothetical protein